MTQLDEDIVLDDAGRDAFVALIDRLNQQSLDKHYDAYVDLAWDDPENAIDPHDPRWELPSEGLLAQTEWYRSLPAETRAEIGLYRAATAMKIGLQFENILKRGLLRMASRLPNGAPEYRYIYHEVIEECHHGMMFQEFVNRAGYDIRGLSRPIMLLADAITLLGSIDPALFMIFVIGGEDPIDYEQRQLLRSDWDLPPLAEQIFRNHVTEEARHLSFARNYLKRHVPRANPVRRFAMSVTAPVVLGIMTRMMIAPTPQFRRHFGVPRSVLREAYYGNTAYKTELKRSLRKIRKLCTEIGLSNPVSRTLWRVMGVDETAEEERERSVVVAMA